MLKKTEIADIMGGCMYLVFLLVFKVFFLLERLI